MESKHMLMSALGVGIGVGVGFGLASGSQAVSKWAASDAMVGVTPYTMEMEMLSLLSNGRDSNVTFEKFPYYLSEQTRVLLTSAAFVHLKEGDFSKHIRNLSPASRTILLSGPAELYQQMLAKALAHYFEAKLLLLDVTDFSLKMLSKYGGLNTGPSFKRSVSETTLSRMSDFIGSLSLLQQKEVNTAGTLRRQSSGVDLKSNTQESPNPAKLRRNASAAANIDFLGSTSSPSKPAPLMRTSSWCFDEKLFIQTLYRVLVKTSKVCPVVLYLRDVERILCRSQRSYVLFQKMLKQLSGSILILGSRIINPDNDYRAIDEKISSVFPYNIEIKPPEDKNHLVSWQSQLEEDMRMIQFKDNKNHIIEVLAANDIDCDDLDSIGMVDTMVLGSYIEEIVVSAISYHLMNTNEPEYRNGKLVISSKSLSHGLSIFQKGKSAGMNVLKSEPQAATPKVEPKAVTPKAEVKTEPKAEAAVPEKKSEEPPVPKTPEVIPDNEFEKRIRPEVIPASEIGVTFADIGALDEIKESLQELVMLPLRRPDLFEGGLLKPCRGILLFGPPGTGKTMLAKAIANEAGASFINVSMSTITSKWFGEDEKNVRALFTLAAKVSPTIIFVDEVDSMLGQRNRAGEHEAMRKIKNEFMTHWDGLLTKTGEKILVLAATNRPFDLDEAIIRRFERRIMVGLPVVENREKILRTLLSKEKVDEDLDFLELATTTEGYSGSDLKNLCITAAYRPVRELIKQERLKDQKKKHASEEVKQQSSDTEDKKERVIMIRPLNMEDFREARKQVAASFAAEGSVMAELKQWNEAYGEGGSRKKEQLSYFL
ncbi:spastin isoform X3 [Salvia divinorum]|uniref:Spastin isoform X3 n=1 Tax=Salvia divinorum TaxID=28513 RepID=A0ABD1H6W4_SALDI